MAVGLVNVDRPAAQDRFVLSTPATSPPDQLKVIVTLAGDAIIQVGRTGGWAGSMSSVPGAV